MSPIVSCKSAWLPREAQRLDYLFGDCREMTLKGTISDIEEFGTDTSLQVVAKVD